MGGVEAAPGVSTAHAALVDPHPAPGLLVGIVAVAVGGDVRAGALVDDHDPALDGAAGGAALHAVGGGVDHELLDLGPLAALHVVRVAVVGVPPVRGRL